MSAPQTIPRSPETREDLSPIGQLLYDITKLFEANKPTGQDWEERLERIGREREEPLPTVSVRFADGTLTVSDARV